MKHFCSKVWFGKNEFGRLMVFYFLLGCFGTITQFALRCILVDRYGLGIASISTFLYAVEFPWFIKPANGWISDNLACCGFRRKPYMIGANALGAAVSFALMDIESMDVYMFFGVYMLLQAASVMADVMYDACMVTATRMESDEAKGITQTST